MLGLWCEAFKLYLGPCALLGLVEARTIAARIGYLCLLALTLVFMSGSVGATFMFTTQTDAIAVNQKQAAASQALEGNPEYQEALLDRKTLNDRIARASGVADGQAADNQRRLSMGTDTKLDDLQAKKDAVSERIKAMRSAAHISDDIATPSAADGTMSARELVHLAVAILLEVGSIAAFTLVHVQLRRQRKAAQNETPRSGGLVAMDGGKKPRRQRSATARRPMPSNGNANAPLAGIGYDFEQQYAKVRELVMQGIIAPTLHAIMDAVHVSQRPAQRFREALCGEGLVQRDERGRYRLRIPLAA
jgi:hypothetical protein